MEGFPKGQLRLTAALFFLVALNLYGEGPQSAKPSTPSSSGTGSTPSTIQRVQVFDDRVFELGVDKSAPTTSKSGTTGTERYLAEEPDYNTGQRNEWLQKCSGEANSKAFSECFTREKERGRQQLRERNNVPRGDLRSPWQGEERRGKGLPKE